MLLKRIESVWKNYFVGQFLVTIFVFLATWGTGFFTGLRFPLLNALAAGICENIPNFGPVISGIISGALALAFGSSRLDIPNWQFMIIIVLSLILIQLLQNWLISPLIIGKKMDLHPLLVLAGMTVFSIIFGFWGMILAVPIMGTLREVYRYNNRPREKPDDPLQLP
ncbi:MAG: AI-2E family transporter [Flexilinea sp.]|nr:AI-2E family transporter [Flexilinea sp.]